MNKTFYTRYAGLIVLAVCCALPLMIFGGLRAMGNANNDIRQWLPSGFAETQQYDWFLDNFGSEELAVVSWPGATLSDERVERLAEALGPWTVGGEQARDHPQLFNRVLTAHQLLAELTSEPMNLTTAQALERLQGTLIGPDQQTTGLVVMVSEAGEADRHRALDVVYRVAEDEVGLARSELRMGGPTVDSVALDTESQRARYLLAGLSVVFALLLAWACLRRLQLVMIVFATAILSAITSVALVYFTGNTMSLMLITMPTLIYVLAISGSVHLVNYYRDALADGAGAAAAPARAVAAGWLPCTLSACTTAVGLGSLALSDVVPVKMFGMYSALGVLASLPLVLLFLPAVLQLWPLTEHARRSTQRRIGFQPVWRRIGFQPVRRSEDVRPCAPVGQVGNLSHEPYGWACGMAAFMVRRYGIVLAGLLSLMVLGGIGAMRLDTSVKLLNLFSPHARIIQDYTWLEQHLGPLVPVEIVVHLDRDNSLSMQQRLELVRQVQDRLNEMEKVGGTMSAATFAPPLPDGGGARQVFQRRLIENRMEQARDQLIEANYLREVTDGQLWRVSARVEALNSLDYGQFIHLLREQVDPVLQQHAGAEGERVEATYTGVVPLVYKAQRALLSDLTRSFLTAFLLVGLVMVLMLRSFSAGVLAMVPSIFPAVLVFGGMGWLGVLCDIGAMMTASVALGIAVDDTIHFLSWFRRGVNRGASRAEAVGVAYQKCAKAMLQTTIICGLGLLVFGLSSFVPTSRFATLMFTMLVAALIGDLLLLPALLASPLGKFFTKPPRPVKAKPQRDRVRPVPGHPWPAGGLPMPASNWAVAKPQAAQVPVAMLAEGDHGEMSLELTSNVVAYGAEDESIPIVSVCGSGMVASGMQPESVA